MTDNIAPVPGSSNDTTTESGARDTAGSRTPLTNKTTPINEITPKDQINGSKVSEIKNPSEPVTQKSIHENGVPDGEKTEVDKTGNSPNTRSASPGEGQPTESDSTSGSASSVSALNFLSPFTYLKEDRKKDASKQSVPGSPEGQNPSSLKHDHDSDSDIYVRKRVKHERKYHSISCEATVNGEGVRLESTGDYNDSDGASFSGSRESSFSSPVPDTRVVTLNDVSEVSSRLRASMADATFGLTEEAKELAPNDPPNTSAHPEKRINYKIANLIGGPTSRRFLNEHITPYLLVAMRKVVSADTTEDPLLLLSKYLFDEYKRVNTMNSEAPFERKFQQELTEALDSRLTRPEGPAE